MDSTRLNTKFFHAQLKSRQERNHISLVCNEQGIIVTDTTQVQQELIKFFHGLMGTYVSEMRCLNSIIANDGYCLNMEKQEDLIKVVLREEIMQTLNDMPSDKAPCGNGFSVEFLKAHWDTVIEEVSTIALQFLEIGKILK